MRTQPHLTCHTTAASPPAPPNGLWLSSGRGDRGEHKGGLCPLLLTRLALLSLTRGFPSGRHNLTRKKKKPADRFLLLLPAVTEAPSERRKGRAGEGPPFHLPPPHPGRNPTHGPQGARGQQVAEQGVSVRARDQDPGGGVRPQKNTSGCCSPNRGGSPLPTPNTAKAGV